MELDLLMNTSAEQLVATRSMWGSTGLTWPGTAASWRAARTRHARWVLSLVTSNMSRVSYDVFNVRQYWTDLAWNGCELEGCQDAAHQVGCHFL
jgi:hypothetical protein